MPAGPADRWAIKTTDEVRTWLRELRRSEPDTFRSINTAVDILAERGPGLGRPLVDTLRGSSIGNLKELRPRSGRDVSIRILFVFDPWSQAILLVGGNKAGDWDGWYRSAIPTAEIAYELAGVREEAEGGLMTEFHDWQDIRAELHDGDDEALAEERARTEAWVSAFHLTEERKRLGMTQKQVADIMGVTPGRVSQIENGDLDVNEVATLSRYAQALGARLRIIFDYGDDLRQIA
ncbi:type II toxin-antitoxin system RelE/ParE family toxin [Dactylosporangium sp. NPDC051541]|uniref:type II toxin-antitoxin system RelE/ParE family toxin n=1 Tax=Dactylosporangium sp. NPDC051541 TaxID=3363977 RepID=UPI0037B97B28